MARTGYLVIIYQDINPSSPTYNQTREERTQDDENCPTSAAAHWIEDTRYCELNERGMYTGYEITVYRDVEPLSPTYNETTQVRELNTTDCEEDETTPDWRNIGDPYCREIVYMPGGLLGNDGYMVQQQQDMNEYSPTAEEIREVEIQDLEHCPLPNTEAVWETVSESCHIVEYQGQLVYDGTKDIIRTNTNQYSPTWNNNIPETVNVEDLINCPPAMEIQYRWVESSGQYVCVGYDKYSVEKKQRSIDGTTWTDVLPLQTREGSLIEHNSEDCGYEPTIEYRWVVIVGLYECVGYDKYSVEKKQQSTDGGTTWTDVVPSETRQGSVIEHNSVDCGYIPPEYRWITVEGAYMCVGYDLYTLQRKQVSNDGGTTWRDVVPYEERAGSLIDAGSEYCGYIPPQYRWVVITGAYTCVGYDKYAQEKQQVSNDGGTTWTDTGSTRTGSLIEHNSVDCGYIEPQYRWITVSGDYMCVGYDKYSIEKRQVSYDGGTTWEDVVPSETRQGSVIEHNSEDCGYVPLVYSSMYLTFVAIENGTFTFTGTLANSLRNSLSYSLDEGQTWTALASGAASPTVTTGNKIMWKGNCVPRATSPYEGVQGIGTFSSTGRFDVEGNAMSLLYGDNFEGQTELNEREHYVFHRLFYNNANLVNAENLSLPATTLSGRCYWEMFYGCTSLVTAPELPATTLGFACYDAMFQGCNSLTTAPQLPATTLADGGCYYSMFRDCTSLTAAPELPATTLGGSCYYSMFWGCTSLTTAPQLPATTMTIACYRHMFRGCTSLTAAPALPATTLVNNCYHEMFYGCTSLTTTPALPATTLAYQCYYSMFFGCTSLTTAPSVLPATTLAEWCYGSMFYNCTNLTTAPQLPATTLVTNCYAGMFQKCTSLVSAPALPATTLATQCYNFMFEGCTSLTTAPTLPAGTLANNCYQGMFQNCTSLTTAPSVLPATTLANYCYSQMFLNCPSLTAAPELPATTLADHCYYNMFNGCTSLNYIKCLATDISASSCTNVWVKNVSASGTFIKAAGMNDWTTGDNGIPSGWTVVDAS